MAKKKDFSTVSSAIAEATAQDTPKTQEIAETPEEPIGEWNPRKARKTYTEEEKFELMQACKTQGRKGAKEKRINMAFTPEQYYFITTMARSAGITMTALVQKAIDDYRDAHEEAFQAALELRKKL